MDILIDEMDGSLWVASVDKNKIRGLEVDPVTEEVRWGSLYWAQVARIDAKLDAAFVSLDGDNQGILQSGDLRIKQDGEIYKGGDLPIGKLVSPGDFILVQTKDGKLNHPAEDSAFDTKLPKVTMNIAIQGRYLIYTPFEEGNRISKRIRKAELRAQLQEMLEDLVGCDACILRAAAANTQTDIIKREHKLLGSMWEQLEKHAEGSKPQLIMLGPDAVQRTLSDMSSHHVDTIEIVTMDVMQEVEEWCELFAPEFVTKITPVELENPYDNLALYDYRDILDQIDLLFQPYAILEGGANIVIQQTAALTAIDVNRGADSDSILNINRKAAEEAARQIRIRNLGGIIMVDFLKMKSDAERKQLFKHLSEMCDNDPCTVQLHGFTKLGLMEMTRHQRTPSLSERFESSQIS